MNFVIHAIARLRVCLVLRWHGWRYSFRAKEWRKETKLTRKRILLAFDLVNKVNASEWMGHEPQTLQVVGLSGHQVDPLRNLWRVRYRIVPIDPSNAWPYRTADFAKELP